MPHTAELSRSSSIPHSSGGGLGTLLGQESNMANRTCHKQVTSELTENISLEESRMAIQREMSPRKHLAPTLLKKVCSVRALEPGSVAPCSTVSPVWPAHKTQTDIMPAHK